MREGGSACAPRATLFTGTVLSKNEQPVNTTCYPEYQVILGSYGRGDFREGRGEGEEEGKGRGRVSPLSCLPFSLLSFFSLETPDTEANVLPPS